MKNNNKNTNKQKEISKFSQEDNGQNDCCTRNKYYLWHPTKIPWEFWGFGVSLVPCAQLYVVKDLNGSEGECVRRDEQQWKVKHNLILFLNKI